ncbi:hypothetical protein PCASD_04452 [Puccinia coronata f. sp. avenae]|uniref:Uncharacterized protein n=1 Tax=Puccinia coronata f. sp. avenae TaxID=200324 RepID=A0A2N5VBV1_9BASI|nr:hypothetical protein PCASD_04452 [Puccinia coronata f. sp. avenae]
MAIGQGTQRATQTLLGLGRVRAAIGGKNTKMAPPKKPAAGHGLGWAAHWAKPPNGAPRAGGLPEMGDWASSACAAQAPLACL